MGVGVEEGEGRANGRRGGSENWDWYIKFKKIVCFLLKNKKTHNFLF